MRRPIIAGNWKLHKTVAQAKELANQLKSGLADVTDRDIIIAPVYTAIVPLSDELAGSQIQLAGQNCYPAENGAYTGEVSPSLLKDAGCRAVIVGHSERRQLFAETDSFINSKIKALQKAGLESILCVGETLDERESGAMFDVLARQIKGGLEEIDEAATRSITIAYEPVWAIGTGKVASAEQAQEAHVFIRGLLAGLYGMEVAESVRILYGGSVKPDNIDGLMAQEDIDGALVGGASLKAEDFIRIVRFKPV